MSRKRKRPGRRPIIDAAAKVAMLAALREGRRLEEVAEIYGVTLQAFYSARRRDPVFAAAWRDAHALSAEAERRQAPEAAEAEAQRDGAVRIASNSQRLWQRRKMRHVRFDERRKGIFLAAFARSCDLVAAAAAAGISERTVYNHLRSDPAFAEAFQAALEGYGRLEAESLRQRLEAQAGLRAPFEAAEAAGAPLPVAEEGLEFDRAMKLMQGLERKDGRLGPLEVGPEHRRRLTFEEAIADLDRKLEAFGLRSRSWGGGRGGGG